MKYDYSKVNFENIQKLHDFVPKIKNLAMDNYTEGTMFDLATAQSSPEHPCGTAACLIGNGPSAGIPVNDKHFDHTLGDGVDWYEYSTECFIGEDDYEIRLWVFAFDVRWTDCKEEAQARLKLILDKEVPIEWAYDELFCKANRGTDNVIKRSTVQII